MTSRFPDTFLLGAATASPRAVDGVEEERDGEQRQDSHRGQSSLPVAIR